MALKGIKVLEFGGLAPGPFCGMVLADFGADVLRIDKLQPGIIDCLGNGKQVIALNLKHPEGVKIVKQLCKKSDVLLEPFRQGVMESLGLGPSVLLKENPRLIYARLTGYGQTGIMKNLAGHDINYLSMSGLLSLFGRKNEKPLFPNNLAADFGGGGLTCSLGILMALFERTQSGLGQVIDCNMVEGTAYLGSWLYRSQNQPWWGRGKMGENVLDSGAHFYEVYRTKDNKFVSVGAIEPQFYEKLLQGLGLSEDKAPQFSDFDELKRLFTEKFMEKTQKEWVDIFGDGDACVTPVLGLQEAATHPHNVNSFIKSEEVVSPKPAPNLSRTPATSKSTEKLPKHGQHTYEILKKLNYSDEIINKLLDDNVIFFKQSSKL
ncbi:unnamed protein product [Brassicogethes aeneus]|uniref:Alpha-methylacyl-CoA racemase n=1 Tax=Brassicogethes aeneus TaxID=1431903 RepID=A0A9P0B9Z2_BRAAE|nr:unnamed protein product [Brassicogethes aeneus]